MQVLRTATVWLTCCLCVAGLVLNLTIVFFLVLHVVVASQASKFALMGFYESLRMELAGKKRAPGDSEGTSITMVSHLRTLLLNWY